MIIEEVIGNIPCVRDERKAVWRLRKFPYGNVFIALQEDIIVFGATIHNIDFDLFKIPQSEVNKRRFNINTLLEKVLVQINHYKEGDESEALM